MMPRMLILFVLMILLITACGGDDNSEVSDTEDAEIEQESETSDDLLIGSDAAWDFTFTISDLAEFTFTPGDSSIQRTGIPPERPYISLEADEEGNFPPTFWIVFRVDGGELHEVAVGEQDAELAFGGPVRLEIDGEEVFVSCSTIASQENFTLTDLSETTASGSLNITLAPCSPYWGGDDFEFGATITGTFENYPIREAAAGEG